MTLKICRILTLLPDGNGQWWGSCKNSAFKDAAMLLFARTVCLVLASGSTLLAQSPSALPQVPKAPSETLAPTPVPLPSCETAKLSPALPPYAGPLWERSTLGGDWFGHRSNLRDCGWTFDINSTQFYQGVVDGGLSQQFRFGGRADIFLKIDGQKTGLWEGFFVDLHNETLYGQSVNALTGGLMPVSIAQVLPTPDTPVNALTGIRFTQALSEQFALFAGKINTVDGFRQPFAGYRGVEGFMNINFAFPNILARTTPYSAWGGGFVMLRDLEPIASFMVLDTNNTPTTTGFPEFFDNGVSILGIVNLPTNFFGRKGHQGIGGTYSNRSYSSLDNIPYLIISTLRPQLPPAPQETGSWTVFYMFDQTIRNVCCDETRSWGLFGNAGISDGNPNPVRWTASIGLGGAAPIASRPYDSFGVGYFYNGFSSQIKNFAPRLLALQDEQGIETFYTVGLSPWCKITADLQVIDPIRSRVDTAVVFGLRAKLDF